MFEFSDGTNTASINTENCTLTFDEKEYPIKWHGCEEWIKDGKLYWAWLGFYEDEDNCKKIAQVWETEMSGTTIFLEVDGKRMNQKFSW